MSGISFQPVRIDGHDAEGSFLLHDGQLLAVVARLDCESVAPEFKGRLHLEAGFGPCEKVGTRSFENLDEAAQWAFGCVRTNSRR